MPLKVFYNWVFKILNLIMCKLTRNHQRRNEWIQFWMNCSAMTSNRYDDQFFTVFNRIDQIIHESIGIASKIDGKFYRKQKLKIGLGTESEHPKSIPTEWNVRQWIIRTIASACATIKSRIEWGENMDRVDSE